MSACKCEITGKRKNPPCEENERHAGKPHPAKRKFAKRKEIRERNAPIVVHDEYPCTWPRSFNKERVGAPVEERSREHLLVGREGLCIAINKARMVVLQANEASPVRLIDSRYA